MDKKIVDKVRKLLAMANDNASGGEHERDTALRMAHNLLAKHNLSMADVKSTDKEGRKSDVMEMTSHAWAKIVAMAVSRLFFCEIFFTKIGAYGTTRMRMTFIGLESNVITASEMTAYIIKSINKEASHIARILGKTGGFQRSFCNGAANKINERCHLLRKEAEQASKEAPTLSPGKALVLANLYETEKNANNNFIVEVMKVDLKFKDLQPRSNAADGYIQGNEFACKINLNKQICITPNS